MPLGLQKTRSWEEKARRGTGEGFPPPNLGTGFRFGGFAPPKGLARSAILIPLWVFLLGTPVPMRPWSGTILLRLSPVGVVAGEDAPQGSHRSGKTRTRHSRD